MSIRRLYLAAVVAVMACATTGTNSGTGRRANLLTAMEIAENHADVNSAYDAVARLRPNWLVGHGPSSSGGAGETAQVFVDGQAIGDIQALRNIQAFYVASMEYFDTSQAGARFGIRAGGGGAIEVRLKTP